MKIKLLLIIAIITVSYSTAFSATRTKSKVSKKTAKVCKTDKCRSAAQVFGDVYEKWGAVIIATGCVAAVNVGTGGVAMAATLNCIKNSTKYAESVEQMVSFFNAAVNNNRWTIGPRRMDWGKVQTGAVVSTFSRVFISAAPVDKDTFTVKVKKTDGRAQADIIICKVDDKGNFIKIAQVKFAEGDENIGQTITKTVTGVKGHLVQVRIDADSAVKKFEYQFTATK